LVAKNRKLYTHEWLTVRKCGLVRGGPAEMFFQPVVFSKVAGLIENGWPSEKMKIFPL
jgi:hypothetical protein